MTGLSIAVNVLLEQKRNGTYRGARICTVKQPVPCLEHFGRQAILMERSRYGDGNTVTLERPMGKTWLKRQKEKGSLLTTCCTMVCVPREHVKEVRGVLPMVNAIARLRRRLKQ